ncbi:Coproporphyrinogen III oxidase [Gammaproteobacteria bacterium]
MIDPNVPVEYAIVGGGISGLSTAWFLKQRGYSVRVLEAELEVGGTLRSHVRNGFLIERGPNSTLENTDALGELIEGVGLDAKLQVASPLGKRRYLFKNQRLVPLPLGPIAFLGSPLFSVAGKLRLFAEPFIGRASQEESVAEFVRRRLGQEFLDWAIDPFISGVYAGDPEKLSVRAATAKVYALEAQYGSLLRGMIIRGLSGKKTGPTPSGRLISFSGGIQTLARGVANALGPESVRTRVQVTKLSRVPGGWQVHHAKGHVSARNIVLCLPADKTADLVAPFSQEAAETLRAISYPPVASIALGFRREQIKHPLNGFGLLIPRRCGLTTLGCLFSSSLFPDRAPTRQVLITSFLGGARHPEISTWKEKELILQVLEDLRPILGIQGSPTLQTTILWPRAIPQYELGHLDRVAKIDQALAQSPGLFTRANWRDGISVADCVRNARSFSSSQLHAQGVLD